MAKELSAKIKALATATALSTAFTSCTSLGPVGYSAGRGPGGAAGSVNTTVRTPGGGAAAVGVTANPWGTFLNTSGVFNNQNAVFFPGAVPLGQGFGFGQGFIQPGRLPNAVEVQTVDQWGRIINVPVRPGF